MSDNKFVFLSAGIPGVFVFDQEKNLVACSTFPQDRDEITEKLKKLDKGEEVEELIEVVSGLGTENIVTDLPLDLEGFNVEVREEVSSSAYLQDNLRNLAKESGFVEKDEDFNRIIRDIHVQKTREKIKSSVEKDKVASQAVSALQDLRRISNEMSERLREWYGLYYPELKVEDNEKYAEIVSNLQKREKSKEFDGSMGIDLDREDIETMRNFADGILEVFEKRDSIKDYIEGMMGDVSPNLTHLIGAEMAAQLISLAGSLEKLARMPSSKIQLLGAEKALFRHLKGGGKPPKHGIIFNHPYIQNTPEGKRGKAARAIASKLMMAARTDNYTGKFKGEKYKEELEEELERIRNG